MIQLCLPPSSFDLNWTNQSSIRQNDYMWAVLLLNSDLQETGGEGGADGHRYTVLINHSGARLLWTSHPSWAARCEASEASPTRLREQSIRQKRDFRCTASRAADIRPTFCTSDFYWHQRETWIQVRCWTHTELNMRCFKQQMNTVSQPTPRNTAASSSVLPAVCDAESQTSLRSVSEEDDDVDSLRLCWLNHFSSILVVE